MLLRSASPATKPLVRSRPLSVCASHYKSGSRKMAKLARELVRLKATNSASGGRNLGPVFRLLQWNTLADGLAQHGDFIKVPKECLEWESRWPLLLEELADSQADILCLQEVNRFDEFRGALEKMGYQGVFLQKGHSPATQYGFPMDGSALFFKCDRFSLLGDATGKPMHQGLLFVHLLDKQSGQSLIVATTHLKAKDGSQNEALRRKEVRQMCEWLEEASRLSNGAAPTSEPPPVLVCGDFNTTPDSSTCEVVASHGLGLESIWQKEVLEGAEEDLITTFKFRPDGMAKRVIDYIWTSRNGKLHPISRWKMPSDKEIGENGLPSTQYASDHLAVMAEFQWRGDMVEMA